MGFWCVFHWRKPLMDLILSRVDGLYVASAQQGSHSDAAMALAQGNSQEPAQPLSQAPTASLYPGQITSSPLPAEGGRGWCMCQLRCKHWKPRWCLARLSLSSWLEKSFRPTILAWRLNYSTWHILFCGLQGRCPPTAKNGHRSNLIFRTKA